MRPRHVLEEAGVEDLAAGGNGAADDAGALFSLVAADGHVSLGSTFLLEEPNPELWEGRLRGAATGSCRPPQRRRRRPP